MDIDLSPLVNAKEQQREALNAPGPPRVLSGDRVVSGGSGEEEEDPTREMMRRKERLSRRGQLLRDVLGGGGAKFVIDLGEYRRKKVRVFVQYEGHTVNALEKRDRLRVGITIPPKWIDSKASKLKEIFIETYNKRGGNLT